MAPDADPVPLVIIGAGGFGREVLDVVEAVNAIGNRFNFVGFIDDGDPDEARLLARGTRRLTGLDDPAAQGARYLVGIGDPATRQRLSRRADEHALVAGTAVHPSATFGALTSTAPGLVACAHVSVTTNVTLGRQVHLNLSCTVGHDAVLGDYVSVFPGANLSGEVTLGDGVVVGTGAAIIQGVSVGAGTFIGAGSVVTRDLPAGVVAFGSPARPVRSLG